MTFFDREYSDEYIAAVHATPHLDEVVFNRLMREMEIAGTAVPFYDAFRMAPRQRVFYAGLRSVDLEPLGNEPVEPTQVSKSDEPRLGPDTEQLALFTGSIPLMDFASVVGPDLEGLEVVIPAGGKPQVTLGAAAAWVKMREARRRA